MENLFPNEAGGAKFAYWTTTVTGSGSAPVGTYSATSGPDSMPGLSMACTGTSGGVKAVSATLDVGAESMIGLSVILAASNTANSLLVPISISYKDASGNAIITVTPIASAAAASTSAIMYNACIGCPVNATTAVVTFGAYSWTSTGGYSLIMSSPVVLGY
jgi:hypothetical protein